MSLLDLTSQDLDDVEEPITLEAGTEAELRIIIVNEGTNKNNDPYFMPVFEIVDEPLAKECSDYFGLPCDSMNEKQLHRAKFKIANFGKAFDIDFSRPIDLEDLIGLTGWGILGVSNSEEYGEQNTVRKYIIPA